MMVSQTAKVFAVLMTLVASFASAAEDAQWVRVTVLLESGPGAVQRAEESLIPGGVYSLEEVRRRGQSAIDQEILRRIRFLSKSMDEVEQSMRLATLMARQYYLSLEEGKEAVLPVIDLNPRLGIVFTPLRFVGDRAVCKVQFLEPEGPAGNPDFTGDPITLQLKDADLQKVLQAFSQITQVPIDVDPSVEGKVTVDLRDVQWDQALDLVLRINNLGWVKEDGILKVVPLQELSRRKRIRTDATINLPRASWGTATIASRGDSENPTVVLVVESVDGPPGMVAELDGLVHPKRVQLVAPKSEELDESAGELAVFRGVVTEEGRLHDVEMLASPSNRFSDRLLASLGSWQFRTVLDEEGRKLEAVVGYGVRLVPHRALASIGSIEHIGVEVSASPAEDDPELYVIQAQVTDLDSGELISAPRVHARRGDEAMVRTSFVAPGGEPTNLEMSFLISGDGKTISYSWTLTSNGKVLSSHRAEFGL
jgi:hypothetical protein